MPIYGVEKHDSYGTRRAEIPNCSEYDLVFLMDDYNAPNADGSMIEYINIKSIMNKLRNNIMPNCIAVYNTLNVSTYASAENVRNGIIRKAVAVDFNSHTSTLDVVFVSFEPTMLRTHMLRIELNPESEETNEYDGINCYTSSYRE